MTACKQLINQPATLSETAFAKKLFNRANLTGAELLIGMSAHGVEDMGPWKHRKHGLAGKKHHQKTSIGKIATLETLY